MDLILAQYMMLRGEDRRRAEFPDIFTVDSLNEAYYDRLHILSPEDNRDNNSSVVICLY